MNTTGIALYADVRHTCKVQRQSKASMFTPCGKKTITQIKRFNQLYFHVLHNCFIQNSLEYDTVSPVNRKKEANLTLQLISENV